MDLLSADEARKHLLGAVDFDDPALQQLIDGDQAEVYRMVPEFAFLRFRYCRLEVHLIRGTGDQLWPEGNRIVGNPRFGYTGLRLRSIQRNGASELYVQGDTSAFANLFDSGAYCEGCSLYFVTGAGLYAEVPGSARDAALSAVSEAVGFGIGTDFATLMDGVDDGIEYGFFVAEPGAWLKTDPAEHLSIKRHVLIDLLKLSVQYKGLARESVGGMAGRAQDFVKDYEAERLKVLGRLGTLM